MTKCAIFASVAPGLWARSLSAIPLPARSKKSDMNGWQNYLDNLPGDAKQKAWLAGPSDQNVAVLLGGAVLSDYRMFGFDADDDRFITMLRLFLSVMPTASGRPPALCGKRGKKGVTYYVLVPMLDEAKSGILKGKGGLGNIDVLGPGRYTVVPPSIHPDTNAPYEHVGTKLIDVGFDELPICAMDDMTLIGLAIASEYTQTLLTGKGTHEAGLALSAQLIAAGGTDEQITAIITGLLPADYAGNSLDELAGWLKSARAKGFEEARKKKTPMEMMLAAIARQQIAVIIDQQREPYMAVPQGQGPIFEPLRSTSAKAFIWLISFEASGKPIKQDTLNELLDMMEAKALYHSTKERLFLRFGETSGSYVIDPGWEGGERLIISPGSWHTGSAGDVYFRRSPGFGQMARPGERGGLRKLLGLLGLEGRNAILFVVFLMNCMRPAGPYMFLLIEGEQGSGKSLLSSFIRRIIDPNATGKSRLPKNEHELMIAAGENYLLVFDNASGMRWDMSDALCALATGSGYSTRRYYTDNESRTFNFARPVIINGIGQFANRPDLLERSIQLRLPKMPAGKRLPEKELEARFAEFLPDILADLLYAASVALERLPTLPAPTEIRMADAAHWVVAAEEALGFPPGAVIGALVSDQRETMIERALGDPLVLAIIAVTQAGRLEGKPNKFKGSVATLMGELSAGKSSSDHRWLPPTPAHLSNQLKRLGPAFATLGVVVKFEGRTKLGQFVTITFESDSLAAGLDEDVKRAKDPKF